MRKLGIVLCCLGLIGWVDAAEGQFVVVLKNGRQLTVPAYRDEGSTVKIFGLGGELVIPKDQIASISKVEESPRQGLNLIELESAARQEKAQKSAPIGAATKDSAVSDGTKPDTDEKTKYYKRLFEVTQKLEAAKEEYFKETQGGGTSSNVSREGLAAWTMDLASRIHDSQKIRGGGGPSSTPPTHPYAPNYTARETKLSDLRAEVDALQKERDVLIEEMKSKNIPVEF